MDLTIIRALGADRFVKTQGCVGFILIYPLQQINLRLCITLQISGKILSRNYYSS